MNLPVRRLAAAIPILLLAIPILDTLSVMVQRIGEGRSPFSPDKNHIHHKLLALGLGHPSTTDSTTPLGPRRRVAAWLTIALFVVTFPPVPISFAPPPPETPVQSISPANASAAARAARSRTR